MNKRMRLSLAELVLDWTVYPRTEIDSQHAGYITDAMRSGAILPPIIVDAASKRIVDGFHRYKAYQRLLEPEAKIEVELRSYSTEQELLLDAMRLNAKHGARLTAFDRTHCVLLAEKLGIPSEEVAQALNMTIDMLAKRRGRVGKYETISPVSGETSEEDVPIKRMVAHMKGKTVTEAQLEAIDHLTGVSQVFLVDQLILLIQNDLLDKEDERMMERLRTLQVLLLSVL